MNNCIICGKETGDEEKTTKKETNEGVAIAHSSCLTKLKALLAEDSDDTSVPTTQIEKTALLERHGGDWILSRRDISVTTMILAYLNAQSDPCETGTVYDWLRKNEVRCSNPSEYIKKMRNRGEISVLNVGGARMIRATQVGIETLSKQAKKHIESPNR